MPKAGKLPSDEALSLWNRPPRCQRAAGGSTNANYHAPADVEQRKLQRPFVQRCKIGQVVSHIGKKSIQRSCRQDLTPAVRVQPPAFQPQAEPLDQPAQPDKAVQPDQERTKSRARTPIRPCRTGQGITPRQARPNFPDPQRLLIGSTDISLSPSQVPQIPRQGQSQAQTCS